MNISSNILLALMPFWTPWIPPTGLAQLKSFLQKNGWKVKTVDATIEKDFKVIYDKYFHTLKAYVPREKRGNFYNIGHDLLQNHMMAHIHYKDEREYMELVKILVFKIYYCELDEAGVYRLNKIIERFYTTLESYLLSLLEMEKPGVFGLTVYCHNLPASLFAFRLVKEKYPHIKTVMGGGIFVEQLSTGSANWPLFLERTPYIDKIIIGQGEKIFLKFLKGELEETKKVYNLEDLDETPLDISGMDLPDFSDFKLDYYPALGACASVSCPYQCSFCSQTIFFGEYQKKRTTQTVSEIMTLHKRYGFRFFSMTDSLLNPIITGLAREFLNHGPSIYWEGGLRIGKEVCDLDNSLLWRQGGFYKAMIGVESGSQRVLDLIGKKITLQQSRESLFSLASAGIKTTTYWIVGYPGETEKNFQQTLDFIEEVKDYVYEAECHPFQYLTEEVNPGEWTKKSVLLYPGEAKDMLVIQTWIIDCEPPREEIYRRLNRFIQHCNRLGIPNPYSTYDIHRADERWKKLHRNAVPFLADIRSHKVSAAESKQVKKVVGAKKIEPDEGDFLF